MRFAVLPILGFAASSYAAVLRFTDAPTSANASVEALSPRAPPKKGTCSDTNYAIEWYFNIGADAFCNNRFKPTKENPNPKLWVTNGHPETYTLQLHNYRGEPLYQVYKMRIDDNGVNNLAPAKEIDFETCKRKMKEVLSEGKLGETYCVVEGTQDVLFKKGKVTEATPGKRFGRMIYEAYRVSKPP